ncbi:unnamed protein product [Adineta steineri]|uniref:Uncharacterized protein n=1 Tax=Adineta steineri TaxID=433720 RepID=A0A819GD40_9BILA|nr:unnamed protein product [Adineta steineri]
MLLYHLKQSNTIGETIQAEERILNHGSYQTRKEIASIKVIRANGQKQKLLASFQGILSVKISWLFIIDNWQIYSINPRITTTAF